MPTLQILHNKTYTKESGPGTSIPKQWDEKSQELSEVSQPEPVDEDDGSLVAAFLQIDFLASIRAAPKSSLLDVRIQDDGTVYQFYFAKQGSSIDNSVRAVYIRFQCMPPFEQLEQLAMSITERSIAPQFAAFVSEQKDAVKTESLYALYSSNQPCSHVSTEQSSLEI
ncbi:uncharacterized protein LOC134182477 [Corticium candelabrum]|uniref:uncharacterized protein LOC134182477 n=1 Tax=Corticium candelabrum TaxID=121492 RepID=UPI002E26EAEA|nr:uncharacterized protein LOC134182477 [Corticium candelabrum]